MKTEKEREKRREGLTEAISFCSQKLTKEETAKAILDVVIPGNAEEDKINKGGLKNE